MAGINRGHRNYKQNTHDNYGERAKPEVKVTPKRYEPAGNPDPVAKDETDLGGSVLFVRVGLQNKVIRRLKRGEFSYESVLDLHGMRTHEAEGLLCEFLGESIQQELSCVLIIHGKGYHSENRTGVLKPFTLDWLKQQSEVKAFCSAQQRDGGTGAIYVLLKRIRTEENQGY